MLSKQKRLPRKLFTGLLEASRYANSAHFSLRYRFDPAQSPRIGVSVSKKVSKKAVIRNRTRRRAYAVFQTLALPKGLFLLMAKPGAEKLQGSELASELSGLMGSVR